MSPNREEAGIGSTDHPIPSIHTDAINGNVATPGTVDDIAAAVATPGTTVVPQAGTYDVAETLELTDDVTLCLPAGVTLRLADGAETNLVGNDDHEGGNSSIRLLGMGGRLDGNRDTQSGVEEGTKCCIQFRNVTDWTIEGVRAERAATDNVSIWNCPRGTIANCFAAEAGRFGYQIQGGKDLSAGWTRQVTIQGSQARNNGADGFSVGHAEENQFIGCHAAEDGQHGFATDRGFRNSWVGCTANSPDEMGFMIADAGGEAPVEGFQLTNCIATAAGSHGFCVANGSSHGSLVNCLARGSGGVGVRVGPGSSGVTVSNCRSVTSAAHGFEFEGASNVAVTRSQARNNGRYFAGDGFHVTGSRGDPAHHVDFTGCQAVDDDRGSQRHGFTLAGTHRHCSVTNPTTRGNREGGFRGDGLVVDGTLQTPQTFAVDGQTTIRATPNEALSTYDLLLEGGESATLRGIDGIAEDRCRVCLGIADGPVTVATDAPVSNPISLRGSGDATLDAEGAILMLVYSGGAWREVWSTREA